MSATRAGVGFSIHSMRIRSRPRMPPATHRQPIIHARR
jgi:hypothetical protein